jgi:hypothetical protein
MAVNYFNPDGSNGDTTQESEEGEDTGESICSDGGDSISLPFHGGTYIYVNLYIYTNIYIFTCLHIYVCMCIYI